MKSVYVYVFGCVVLVLLPLVALADEKMMTGASFQKECTLDAKNIKTADQVTESVMNKVACTNYINGLLDGLSFLQEFYMFSKLKPMFCSPPEGITVGESIRAIERYLKAHPDQVTEPFRTTAFMAFKDAFPCK